VREKPDTALESQEMEILKRALNVKRSCNIELERIEVPEDVSAGVIKYSYDRETKLS
jgi:hypothetical protein